MPQVQSIYAWHVLYGLATFEEEPPTLSEMCARRAAVLDVKLPYLAAEVEGEVVGYSYATAYRTRSAYRYTIEDSVYVRDGVYGAGVGGALLTALIARCDNGPWRQMIAVIGDSENTASVALHRSRGFELIGTFRAVGYKLGRWVDTVLMQRALGGGGGVEPSGAVPGFPPR